MVVTVAMAGVVIYTVALFYDWAIASAVWEAENRRECIAQSPNGACWAGVIAWGNRFLYGRYPDAEIWRINLALVIFLAWLTPLWIGRVRAKMGIAAGIVLLYPFWAVTLFLGGDRGPVSHLMMSAAMAAFSVTIAHVLCCLFSDSGVWKTFSKATIRLGLSDRARMALGFGLFAILTAAVHWLSQGLSYTYIGTYRWGGLFLTLVVAGIGIASALPTGIILALGRRSRMPVIKALCVVYIELVRSVPLVTLMFMATTLFPVFMPKGVELNKLALAIISVCMFASAYMAETVRGGIQAIPHGQLEAAQAMGLRYWRSMGLIIMPQALRAMIPNIVGSFIDLFKGTAVISIFGFYDLTNMLGAISQSPPWIMLFYEPIFVGLSIYFIGCFAMSRYSLYLERKLDVG
jgi:general L-amino acid transport system permease protein